VRERGREGERERASRRPKRALTETLPRVDGWRPQRGRGRGVGWHSPRVVQRPERRVCSWGSCCVKEGTREGVCECYTPVPFPSCNTVLHTHVPFGLSLYLQTDPTRARTPHTHEGCAYQGECCDPNDSAMSQHSTECQRQQTGSSGVQTWPPQNSILRQRSLHLLLRVCCESTSVILPL